MPGSHENINPQKRGRRSARVNQTRIQLTLDGRAARWLEKMAAEGITGWSEPEIAAKILEDWLNKNAPELVEKEFQRREFEDRKYNELFENNAGTEQ